jgi:hypothetical protein
MERINTAKAALMALEHECIKVIISGEPFIRDNWRDRLVAAQKAVADAEAT